jgi:hypothetical protein
LSSATITTVRLPVWITASVGTSSVLSARMSTKFIVTNIPGTSRLPGLASSSRAFSVRVLGFTSGRMACTLPSKVLPGAAGLRAWTLAPGRSSAAWLSGTSALAHTVDKPLMRKQRGARHHRHAFARQQFDDDPTQGCGQVMRG